MQGNRLHTYGQGRRLTIHHLYQVMVAGIIVAWLSWGSGAGAPRVFAANNTSYVRIIHASPFVGTADVFVDGKPFLNSFAFGSITPYVPIPEGPHKVQIALVGKGIGASALTQTLPVVAGKVFTIAAVGATADTLGLQVFVDDNQVTTDHTRVRFYSLIPDAGDVNVLLGGDTPINGMSYQDGSDYVTMDSGSCAIKLTTANNQSLSQTVSFNPNDVASIFAIGMFNGSPEARLVFAQTPGIPGMPQTGSDPVLGDTTHPVSNLWLGGLLTLLIIGLGTTGTFRYYRRFKAVR
jgi:hypothetical protein